jgi:hypothetical protein
MKTRLPHFMMLLAAVFVAGGGLSSCISGVEIAGAPCPCPESHLCCSTLNRVCVADDQACPETHPSSSREACQTDEECPSHEVCKNWTLSGGQPAGPGECRWSCNGDHPCASGESCAPALHDGQPMDSVNVALACVDNTPAEGCEGLECQQCTPEQLGRTYCDGNNVAGCFFAFHSLCGLTCQAVEVEVCGAAGCEETAQGASCIDEVFGPDWCTEFDCADCGPAGQPGAVFCDGNELVACRSLSMSDNLCVGTCICEQICRRMVVATCADQCLNEGNAHCAQ